MIGRVLFEAPEATAPSYTVIRPLTAVSSISARVPASTIAPLSITA